MIALSIRQPWAWLIELNPEYAKMAEERTNVTPGLALS
jgi:hypothetical protein